MTTPPWRRQRRWANPSQWFYVLDEASPGVRPLGGAAKWWLHHSLVSSPRILRPPVPACYCAADRRSGSSVRWQRKPAPPAALEPPLRGPRTRRRLRPQGVGGRAGHQRLQFPGQPHVRALDGAHRLRRALQSLHAVLEGLPGRTGATAAFGRPGPTSGAGADGSGELPPVRRWTPGPCSPTVRTGAPGLPRNGPPGEAGAHRRLADFLDGPAADYGTGRDVRCGRHQQASPHLRFGEISPFRVWHALRERFPHGAPADVGVFRSELGWREFCWQLLYENPQLATRNYRPEFDRFAWQTPSDAELEAWQQGRTGYPLVDAGMRQLWQTGWMHNRVRMAAASFLVKNLLADWRLGEAWFWDTLVDADAASNPATGSGWPARVRTPRRTSVSSTRSRRARSSTPPAVTCGSLFRSWRSWTTRQCMNRGRPTARPRLPAPIVGLPESRARALETYQGSRTARNHHTFREQRRPGSADPGLRLTAIGCGDRI